MPRGVYAELTHDDIPIQVRTRFVRYLAPEMGDDDGCWVWPLSIASHGYGQIGWGPHDGPRGLVLAHRLSYLLFRGPIPAGMTVDHVCRTRRCCNPGHLRLLSNVENARMNGFSDRKECPHGHPYDEANTYVSPRGDRRCRACAVERRRARSLPQKVTV